MSTIEQSRQERIDQLASQAWSGTAGLFGGFFAALGSGLRGLAELRAAAYAAERPAAESSVTSEVFARALTDSPNTAMDWLYYAAQLREPGERRYCIGMALQIDPESPVVRAEARRLR